MKRRSFLALLAGALAVKPARMLAAAPRRPRPAIDYPYMVWDSFIVESGKENTETLFFPPLPRDFSIHTLGLHFPDDILVDDLRRIFDALTLQVKSDGAAILDRWPIYNVPGPPALGLIMPPPQPVMGAMIMPTLVPREQFSVQLAGPAITLTRPTPVQVILGGVVRVR